MTRAVANIILSALAAAFVAWLLFLASGYAGGGV